MRIAVNDTVLYFDVEGSEIIPDGPALRQRPVILALHGGPGFDHAYFKPALSGLADIAQVIYLDLRGQGRSDRPPIQTCTLEQMADDVAEFCRMLGLDRPVILGHSAGGFVALHLALRHPSTIGRLILVDSAAASADMSEALARLEQQHGSAARAAAERTFGGDFSPESMAEFGRLVGPAYVHDPLSSRSVLEAFGRSHFSAEVARYYFLERSSHYDLRGCLAEIRVPALVVVGASDWLRAPDASRTIASGIPGATLLIIPDAGHFSFGEQPEAFLNAVRHFLPAEPGCH
ncbi:alpha/beta fold hydrolase [soil metagenome]